MELVLKDGKVITGDGKTVLEEASVVIHGELISEVVEEPDPSIVKKSERVIDAKGKIIIPGIINHHTHGIVFGPHMSRMYVPLFREQVIEHLNRHMLQGTTTILSVDGMHTIEEWEETDRAHPVNIKTCTLHVPSFIEGIGTEAHSQNPSILAGAGLKEIHRKLTVDEMMKRGAVAFGELSANRAHKELTEAAERLRIPIVYHNAPTIKAEILEAARKLGPLVIASHSNDEGFSLDEAVEQAKELKKYGAIIDLVSWMKESEIVGEHKAELNEKTIAFFKEGLGDVISTDFAGGHWDSVLWFIEKAIERDLIDLPEAIAMATNNVAEAIPKLAPNRGLIAPNTIADIAIVDEEHVADVKKIIINGKVVVENGCHPREWLPLRTKKGWQTGAPYTLPGPYTKLTRL